MLVSLWEGPDTFIVSSGSAVNTLGGQFWWGSSVLANLGVGPGIFIVSSGAANLGGQFR